MSRSILHSGGCTPAALPQPAQSFLGLVSFFASMCRGGAPTLSTCRPRYKTYCNVTYFLSRPFFLPMSRFSRHTPRYKTYCYVWIVVLFCYCAGPPAQRRESRRPRSGPRAPVLPPKGDPFKPLAYEVRVVPQDRSSVFVHVSKRPDNGGRLVCRLQCVIHDSRFCCGHVHEGRGRLGRYDPVTCYALCRYGFSAVLVHDVMRGRGFIKVAVAAQPLQNLLLHWNNDSVTKHLPPQTAEREQREPLQN